MFFFLFFFWVFAFFFHSQSNRNVGPIRSKIIITINWTKSELVELDHPTRKLLTIHGTLHPRSNISCLYLPRREGGRGLISDEGAINSEDRNINVYISQSQEHLLKDVWKRKNVDEVETPKEYKERMKGKRTEVWSGDQLHGQFKRETGDSSRERQETEGLIFTMQDQALRKTP